jgi:hypothetical protein
VAISQNKIFTAPNTAQVYAYARRRIVRHRLGTCRIEKQSRIIDTQAWRYRQISHIKLSRFSIAQFNCHRQEFAAQSAGTCCRLAWRKSSATPCGKTATAASPCKKPAMTGFERWEARGRRGEGRMAFGWGGEGRTAQVSLRCHQADLEEKGRAGEVSSGPAACPSCLASMDFSSRGVNVRKEEDNCSLK